MPHVHLAFRLAKRDFLLHDGPIWEGTKKGKTKFVIFSQYRTGSTLLMELVGCHPMVHCAGEVFNGKHISQKVLFPCSFLEERFRESQAQTYGVSLKPEQIRKVLITKIYDPKSFLHKLHHKGWKFIHVKRRNVLRQALSNVIANQRGQWHSRSESLETRAKLQIDGTQVLQVAERMELISLMENELLQQIPHVTLVYEEDLLCPERHQETANRVFDYLSLPPATVKANIVRLSTDDISTFVENYSDFVEAIRPTRFRKFLEN